MKLIKLEKYKCEICHTLYDTEKESLECESKPITKNKRDIKVGDIVTILNGDGTGSKAKVTKTFVIDKSWGYYRAGSYWHTIGINANIIGSWGSRMLTFDDYEF